MLKRGEVASTFFICLRCHLRQSFGPAVRKSRLNSAKPSTLRTLIRLLSSSARLRQNGEAHDIDDVFNDAIPIRYVDSPKARNTRPKPYTKAPLGTDSFGKPAEALVLRKTERKDFDLGLLHPHVPYAILPDAQNVTSEDLLEGFNAEKKDLSEDEARQNIDRLKEKFLAASNLGSRLLSIQAYENLKHSIRKGFEKRHLASYIVRTQSTDNDDPLWIDRSYSSELFSRSRWTPDAALAQKNYIPPLGKPISDLKNSHPPRKTLLQRSCSWLSSYILQSCWSFFPQQAEEVSGELTLRLKSNHLGFMLDNNQNVFQGLCEKSNAVIETSRRNGLLRIRASHGIASQVLPSVVNLISQIKTAEVVVESDASRGIGQSVDEIEAYIQQIAFLTGTSIVRVPEQETSSTPTLRLLVHYRGPGVTDLEDAQRLLNIGTESLKATKSKHRSVLVQKTSQAISVAPVHSQDEIPLANRNLLWGRFARILPMSRRDVTSPVFTKPVRSLGNLDDVQAQVFDFLQTRPKHQDTAAIAHNFLQHWSSEPRTKISALLGQLVFPFEPATKAGARFGEDGDYDGFKEEVQSMDSLFLPGAPGITRSLDLFRLRRLKGFHMYRGTINESLVLTLLPSNDFSSAPAEVLPPLEILIDVDNISKTTNFRDARFVLSDFELNLMLPDRMMDVSFKSRSYLYSQSKHPDPCLLDFKDASDLDLSGSTRFKMPRQVQIQVPPHALTGSASLDLSAYKNGLDVRYLFSKVEHRSRMVLVTTNERKRGISADPFSDHRITYTAVEAGRVGGHREELAILGMSDPESGNETTAAEELNTKRLSLQSARTAWEEKARELGPQGRAKRLAEAALGIVNDIELHEVK